MFCANLVIPTQICEELSCGQGKIYGQTDRRTDSGIDNTPSAWNAKGWKWNIYIRVYVKEHVFGTIYIYCRYAFIGFHAIDIIWVIRCESAWCHSILNWKQALILFHTWTWRAWSAETWQLDASKILSAWGASHSLSPVGLISGDSLSLRQVKIRWSSKTYHDMISNCTAIFYDESEHEWIHDKGCHWETSLHK